MTHVFIIFSMLLGDENPVQVTLASFTGSSMTDRITVKLPNGDDASTPENCTS